MRLYIFSFEAVLLGDLNFHWFLIVTLKKKNDCVNPKPEVRKTISSQKMCETNRWLSVVTWAIVWGYTVERKSWRSTFRGQSSFSVMQRAQAHKMDVFGLAGLPCQVSEAVNN